MWFHVVVFLLQGVTGRYKLWVALVVARRRPDLRVEAPHTEEESAPLDQGDLLVAVGVGEVHEVLRLLRVLDHGHDLAQVELAVLVGVEVGEEGVDLQKVPAVISTSRARYYVLPRHY